MAEGPAIEGLPMRLKKAIGKAGGASAISRKSGVALSTLNDYIKGKEPRLSRISALAIACDVSLDWLTTGIDPVSLTKDIAILKPGILTSKAHFWALFVLIRSCQEFHQQMKLKPTLAEVLAWISVSYIKSRDLPDNRIEFKSPEQA